MVKLMSKHGDLSPELHEELSVVLGSCGNMGCGNARKSANQHLRLFSDLHTCSVYKYIHIERDFEE